MSTEIESKIAKLLAMAERTTNPHEAEVFMAKAEELMVRFGVERAQLEATQKRGGAKTEDIVTVRVPVANGHGYAVGLVHIAHAIAPSFNVRTLQSTGLARGGKIVWLIGHASDVKDCQTLWESLMLQAIPQAKAWWRETGRHTTAWVNDNDAFYARREFIMAFANGAGSRLQETRNRVVAEATTGTELVLVDRKKAVDDWIDANLQVGRGRASSIRSGGSAARSAGYRSGRDAINGKALGR